MCLLYRSYFCIGVYWWLYLGYIYVFFKKTGDLIYFCTVFLEILFMNKLLYACIPFKRYNAA